MASYNSVQLIGNLGRDPVYRSTPSGRGIATVSLATTRSWRDRDTNELKSETDWHRVVFEGKTAETARDYLTKGRSIFVEGRLRTRKYQDREGRDVYITEVVVSTHLQMLDRPQGAATPPAELSEDSRGWLDAYDKAESTSPPEPGARVV